MSSDPESNTPPTDSGRRHHHQSSPTDLFSSASFLVGAARSSFSHDGSALDKAKLAESAENLVAAASEYGKLEERGYGSYIEKAETYLHQFHSSPDQKKPADHSPATEKATEGEEHSDPEEKKTPEEHHSGGGFGGFGGGGFGDYLKVAEGFLKKYPLRSLL
ncbi:hypothetical protein KSP40_PGU015465 [Platanthera guangdongensis]|uniref:Uncharacterized protein n=1 Tax=Platanthera guangdongensis TaxID=2320717 RepID=A0ABR2ME73_9ASPA